MNRKRSVRRRAYHKPPFLKRAKEGCRKFTAFMFSNVGIILLVVLYTIAGAIIFSWIETGNGIKHTVKIKNSRATLVKALWNITYKNNVFNETVYSDLVEKAILIHQQTIIESVQKGWPGAVNATLAPEEDELWSFSAGFLYSLTVITTIGYGNISPQTEWGKVVTIVYAIIGMPLFLLYLSNIGDILAKSFKWIYAKIFLCRVCPGVSRRRAMRERRKTRDFTGNPDWTEFQIDINPTGWNMNGSENTEESSHGNENYINQFSSADGSGDDSDESNMNFNSDTSAITVPLTVCLAIMISYILFGAFMFCSREDWDLLDGSYFCFISLSSIGFGDIVPGFEIQGTGENLVDLSSAMCALYLLLGMALIAMCFNLMQEQVIHKIRTFKKVLRKCFRCGG